MDPFANLFWLPKETTWYCPREGQKIGSTDCRFSPWISGSSICPQLTLVRIMQWDRGWGLAPLLSHCFLDDPVEGGKRSQHIRFFHLRKEMLEQRTIHWPKIINHGPPMCLLNLSWGTCLGLFHAKPLNFFILMLLHSGDILQKSNSPQLCHPYYCTFWKHSTFSFSSIAIDSEKDSM